MTGKLTLLRCQTCGGEVKVLTADELRCLYCGNVYTLLGVGLVPLGREQPMYLSEPVPEEGYYFVGSEWVNLPGPLPGPTSADITRYNQHMQASQVTHPGVTLREFAKSIAARWRGGWW